MRKKLVSKKVVEESSLQEGSTYDDPEHYKIF